MVVVTKTLHKVMPRGHRSTALSRPTSTIVPPTGGWVSRLYYYAGAKLIAFREIQTGGGHAIHYVHTDHLSGTNITTNSSGIREQEPVRYTPFGNIRTGSQAELHTGRGFTGQYNDAGIRLMYFNARYYSPYLNRFVSADSVVPDGDQASIVPLTVDFHESGVLSRLNLESAHARQRGIWSQLSGAEKARARQSRGPRNPQLLNRFSYASNNPVNFSDPSGHDTVCKSDYAQCSGGRVVNKSLTESILVKGDLVKSDGSVLKDQIFRLGPGESSIDKGIVDVDEIYTDITPIDGHGRGDGTKISDGTTVEVSDNGSGQLTAGRPDWSIFGVTLSSAWYAYPYGTIDDSIVSTPDDYDYADVSGVAQGGADFAALFKVPFGIGEAVANQAGWFDCSKQGSCAFPP